MAGAVGQQRVPKHFLQQSPFPLPPLAEQERIVAYLDENLGKIDNVCGKLQDFLAGAEERKERLIQAGVSGHLTENWRRRQNNQRDGWELRTLGSLGLWGGGGTPKKSVLKYWENGTIRWVTPKDVKNQTIETTKDRMTEIGVKESSAIIYRGPALCLVVRSGILRRTLPAAIINGEFTVNQDMKVLHSPNKMVNIKFIHYFLMAREATIRKLASKSGTTVESIDFRKLTSLSINLPPLAEQEEIVRVLDNALSSLAEAYSRARESLDKLNLVKQQLVSAALAGRLT